MGKTFAGIISGALLGTSLVVGAIVAKQHYTEQSMRNESTLLAQDGGLQAPKMTLSQDLKLAWDEFFFKNEYKFDRSRAELVKKLESMDNEALRKNYQELVAIANDSDQLSKDFAFNDDGPQRRFREFESPKKYALRALDRLNGVQQVQEDPLVAYLRNEDATAVAAYVVKGLPMELYQKERAVEIIWKTIISERGTQTCKGREPYLMGKAIRILAPHLVPDVLQQYNWPGSCGSGMYSGLLVSGLKGND